MCKPLCVWGGSSSRPWLELKFWTTTLKLSSSWFFEPGSIFRIQINFSSSAWFLKLNIIFLARLDFTSLTWVYELSTIFREVFTSLAQFSSQTVLTQTVVITVQRQLYITWIDKMRKTSIIDIGYEIKGYIFILRMVVALLLK